VRDDVAEIDAASRAMADTISVLVDLARDQVGAQQEGECTAARLAEDLALHFAQRPGLQIDLPDELVLEAPPAVVLRAAAPIVENALRLAGNVAVTATAHGSTIDLVVHDDGPGVDRAVLPRLFEPGASVGGSGLGLALARRVARNAGGEVSFVADAGPGTTFVLTLPGRAGPTADEGAEA
jgi:signal transduction histidine kinase